MSDKKQKEFLRIGNRIITAKDSVEEYDLIKGKIYNLNYDRYQEVAYLEENGDFNLPEKVYHSEDDTFFIKRVLTYFNNTKKQTTGVLLNGVKGTGKTVMAKKIAMEAGLPIIIPSPEFPERRLFEFAKQFKTEVVFFFDEIEKTIDTKHILTFLDGVEATSKKLVLMTSNTVKNLDENLFDRPSRIRYYKTFDNNDNMLFIKDILKDKSAFTEEEIDYIYNFISANCNTISIDNIMSIIEEILIFAINKDGKLNKENLAKLLNNFNIVKKKDATGVGFSKSTTITDFENEVFDFSGASEDDEDEDDEDDDEKIEDEDKILPYYSDEDGD